MSLERSCNASLIPVIDFAAFLDESTKHAVAGEMLQSFKDIGFVYLINHGIPQAKVTEMFEMSKKFFALPLETKNLAPHPPSGTHHRGFSAQGQEKVTQHVYDSDSLAEQRAQAPDAKESFECGREEDELMPNIWLPEGTLVGFKETCLEFFWLCHKIELNILRALALGFGLDEAYFTQCHTVADNQLRLLHYPSVPFDALQQNSIARIGAHSDFGSITLLLQDDVGGLEIEDPNVPGAFRSVIPVPGGLLVNAGDFMMRWSNDTIKSTIHRVCAPPGTTSGMTPERYSIPYFCSADFSTVVDCIPGTWDEGAGRPKKYEPISAKEYILRRLEASY
ncbi:thymine dioxygenase [Favolaschia claudopus]|uniref:Thymine dioxygenase n=1 Tax=Favolaschia claudopus TaxID=2862362 RepID=A0AAW0D3G6_9AGAR